MNTDSCDMVPQVDDEAVMAGPVGSFCFEEYETHKPEKQKVMVVKLPDGSCGILYLRPIINGGDPDFKTPEQPSWQWDGNKEKPTLHPSVHRVGHWHGWFRNGRMVTC